jgi:hypothetical protein
VPDRKLATYLNDHLGGATGGLELARRTAGSNEGNEYGAELQRLVDEINEDREALRRLMAGLGIGEDRIKMAGGWAGEKLGRLKPNGALLSYSPLSRLIEIEGLYLGVTGKLSLWTNLEATHGPLVGGVDVAEYARRAAAQQERLEDLRRRAAQEALAG